MGLGLICMMQTLHGVKVWYDCTLCPIEDRLGIVFVVDCTVVQLL